MYARLSIAIAVLALAGCQTMPEAYAPPVQRQPLENFRPYRVSRVVDMSDGDADSRIVSDIGGLAGTWRWTGQKPTVKVMLPKTDNIRYVIDFAIADVTFKETGPVAVTFLVNDKPLETVRFTQSGEQHFEKDVPAEWLEAGKEALVAAEVDKVWVAPADGAKLGLILSRLGLTQ